MRVLTVRQPWAWAIIHGGKDVENRVRSLGPYRGPVAIHAARADADNAPVALWRQHADFYSPRVPRDSRTNSVRSAVIGVVDLVDVHQSADCWRKPWKWETDDPGDGGFCSAWAMTGHHHLDIENPRPLLRPIPATGRLGLWRPDDALLSAITEQIEVAA